MNNLNILISLFTAKNSAKYSTGVLHLLDQTTILDTNKKKVTDDRWSGKESLRLHLKYLSFPIVKGKYSVLLDDE
jgi:hypothetical protein